MSDFSDNGALDIFACELARIDKLGSNRRLIFALPAVDSGWGGKLVQLKLIVPADYMAVLGALILSDGEATSPSALALIAAEGCA